MGDSTLNSWNETYLPCCVMQHNAVKYCITLHNKSQSRQFRSLVLFRLLKFLDGNSESLAILKTDWWSWPLEAWWCIHSCGTETSPSYSLAEKIKMRSLVRMRNQILRAPRAAVHALLLAQKILPLTRKDISYFVIAGNTAELIDREVCGRIRVPYCSLVSRLPRFWSARLPNRSP